MIDFAFWELVEKLLDAGVLTAPDLFDMLFPEVK